MINKFTPHIILLLFLASFASAQDIACDVQYPTNPEIIERIQAIENQTQEWILEQQNTATTREIITIPVVVHVVWFDESEKFSELEIQAQIDGLTADFRKMNENRFSIPDEFQPLAADIEVEFCLASVSPDAEETNGIVYKKTNITNIGSPSQINGIRQIHYSQYGGSDAWDPEKYINIWVGQLENLSGIATLPGTAPSMEEDGIIIDPLSFRFFCSDTLNTTHGRTLTHEMGHFLNLFHIYGSNNSSGNCDSDDFVNDTPKQDMKTQGCPTHPIESCGSANMFMNFMDNSNDACLSMFTEGQKMRMLATLAPNGPRGTLRNSDRCGLFNDKKRSLNPDNILIYPNPAQECIHIDLDLDSDTEIRMEIFNSIGQPVYSSRIFAKDLRTFDVSRFSNGVYFIYFETNSNGASQKLVIER